MGRSFKYLAFLAIVLFAACSPTATVTPSTNPTPRPVSPTPEGKFALPDLEERTRALGPNPEPIFAHLMQFFEPLPTPGPRDWLTHHPESGQTYHQYEASLPNRPDQRRSKIYILPLGTFDQDDPPLKQVREYTSLFFGQPVVLLEPVSEPAVMSRQNELSWQKQWHAGELLDFLEERLPDDAYCLLGITMTDLYPEDDWNYVFGLAALKRRVGVYSLARYDPGFYGEERGENWRAKGLERSCKVLAHETCHMLGIRHCIYYRCLMNGSNNLSELDSQNSFLCPVCLRKLKNALNPDLHQRYKRLRDFFDQTGLLEQKEWLDQVLQ